MNKKRIRYILLAAICLIGMLVYMLIVVVDKNKEAQVRVGLILSGEKDEDGWNGAHYEGVKEACDNANIELILKENIKEHSGDCEKAVSELAEKNVDMIVLSSYGYSDDMIDNVGDYPEIAFYTNSSEFHDENMTSYFVRMYQARYLSGVLAGMRTKTNKIGYVAAMPNNEVNRGISAFTLGVRSVNPNAEVIVIWTNSWDDSEMEAECTRKLIEECDVDLVTYHQNGTTVIDTAEEYGIYSIGYHQQYEGYSEHYLTSVVCNWDKVYSQIVKELLSGKANTTQNLWIGIQEDAVGLTEFSSLVTEEEKNAVQKAREKLMSGYEIFSGLIYDNENNIQCSAGEIISDEKLLEQFDWYTMGVRFYE